MCVLLLYINNLKIKSKKKGIKDEPCFIHTHTHRKKERDKLRRTVMVLHISTFSCSLLFEFDSFISNILKISIT